MTSSHRDANISSRSNPILSVEGLSKHFGGLTAVDDCWLQIQRGRITGLIGPNGAGKTTLFNLVTGFLRPDSGCVRFNDEDITRLLPWKMLRRRLCRTFQIPREFKDLTVIENLMVVPLGQTGEKLWAPWFQRSRVSRQETVLRDKAREILRHVNLLDHAHAQAWTLSGGQKKLLELARAMMGEPELLLLDEPSAGVNPAQMEELVRHIERLVAEHHITVVVIEHDMDLVMRLCDPVIVMAQGRTLAEGTPDVVRRDPRVLEAYLGSRYAAQQ